MNRAEYVVRRSAIALVAMLAAAPGWAQMDVDQADSLNFHGFHKDKKAAIKVWRDEKSEKQTEAPVKVYEQPSATASQEPDRVQAQMAAQPVAATGNASADNRGKRFEIRERYTLTRSRSTPYSAFFVIEALHQQMAGLCPAGWQKLAERSEPIEADFYLYYELQCL